MEPTSTHHEINASIPIKKDFGLLVREIIGCRDKQIPSPIELINYQHSRILHSHCTLECLYQSTAENSRRYLLKALKAFVGRYHTSDNATWSDVKLSDFNKFLIDRGYAPLKGVIANLILEGNPMDQIEEACIKIQNAFRRLSARQRRNRMVHASITIQRF